MRAHDDLLIERLADWLELPVGLVATLPHAAREAIYMRMQAQAALELQDELVDHLIGAVGHYKDAARIDSLTGLLNRRGLAEQLRELGRRWTIGVMMADIDGFKMINDRFGHAVGDAALQQVGTRLRTVVRQRDLVARWGGDEFLVVCPDITDGAIGPVAAKLLQAVCDAPVTVGTTDVPVSISVGWALAADGQAAEHLVEVADSAMYQAKAAGGSRVIGGAEAVIRPHSGGEIMD
ncbi:MAG TPA: GGDEF domain-containing protein [Candidatus Dormibacteraeota bacterium]|jgi:diguanylate cyclase (GGDEF)-like protein|nr:GGDEF domain-containing protein [Candidatus Dormibacteraeota bacterium]